MTHLFAAYSKKQIMAGILRSTLTTVYMLVFGATLWLCRDFSAADIADRILPYGLPPLLSLVCAGFLSLFVLNLEQIRTETFLFSIICLAFAGLNLDIFLLCIIQNPEIALVISRMDHFLLALILIGANLHLTFLVCEKQTHWWVVYLGYGIGAVMALFTPTDLYFQGVRRYFWGFFAQKAILYDVISLIWLAVTLYAIFLLSVTYRAPRHPRQKETAAFILLGFVCSGLLSLTNTPAMYGVEIYPLGTFTFIPLLLLAWGLFKNNLRIAVQETRGIIFTLGRLGLTAGLALLPAVLLHWESFKFKLAAAVVLVVFFHKPVSRLWDAFLNLFIRRSSEVLQKEINILTGRLSETHHLIGIHREIRDWLFRVFRNSQCATVFQSPTHHDYRGWKTINPEFSRGFFNPGQAVPQRDCPIQIPADHPVLQKIAAARPRHVPFHIIAQWRENPPSATEFTQNTLQNTLQNTNDCLDQAGLVLPVFSKKQLKGLVLIGHHINDRSYTKTEKENLGTITAILGPVIENAQVLESLEEKIQARTRDLNAALESLKGKNRRISQHHGIIQKQNHIFLSLFEAGSRMHELEDLHDLFADTLNRLRTLFPDIGFGIIIEGERAGILETGAFLGISEKEQTLILEHRHHLNQDTINQLLTQKTASPEQPPFKQPLNQKNPAPSSYQWRVQPMQVRENRIIGKIIIKGAKLDGFTQRVISIFLAQVSAAAHNKLLMNKLKTIANTDGLTGVANRACFDRELKKTIKTATLFPGVYFSVIMIDINGLKRINDNFGHDKGDEMIRTVADMLAEECRESDTLSRMGGDEFILLLPATTSAAAGVAAARIREREKSLCLVCRHKNRGQTTLPVRFSIGVAGSDETTAENVMKLADQRMYSDKENFYQKTVETRYRDHS